MKHAYPILCLLAAVILSVAMPGLLFAQEATPPAPATLKTADPEASRYEAEDKPYVKERGFSDAEIVELIDAVKTYVYGKPPGVDSMKVFDREKGDVVVLTYVGIDKDRACHKILGNGFVAICGDLTDPDGEEYVLWFICRRKSDMEEVKAWRRGGGTTERKPLDQVTVRDVTIKAVGGVERFDAVLGEDGMWKAVPVKAQTPTSAPPTPPPAQ